ncbi:hypothetical protein [Fastidiosipila sanguinis]|uniref:Uncharacterized protein n=1 Tax=Fastidiosipila sanguinis TaxID=236753 RepID=A0A2S0KPS2_9FIRM|nr:hypothetical protein [Fastidiosipila sanguinis]AVM43017.1 hypothetical protein C5Q98_07255 [Fastidiosipila sanguinis]
MSKEKKTSDAQVRASRNWDKNNPEKARHSRYKSAAKTFIRHHATEEEMQELEELIKVRREKIAES